MVSKELIEEFFSSEAAELSLEADIKKIESDWDKRQHAKEEIKKAPEKVEGYTSSRSEIDNLMDQAEVQQEQREYTQFTAIV